MSSHFASFVCKLRGHDWSKWRLYSSYFDGDVYGTICDRCGEKRFLKFQKGDIPLWLQKDLIT